MGLYAVRHRHVVEQHKAAHMAGFAVGVGQAHHHAQGGADFYVGHIRRHRNGGVVGGPGVGGFDVKHRRRRRCFVGGLVHQRAGALPFGLRVQQHAVDGAVDREFRSAHAVWGVSKVG